MAVAPPLIAVRFTRQTRDATTKALGGAPRAVTAVPSVGRLTKAADRGFYDLHGWEVTPQSSDGSGILLLEATDANDESWGWTITLAGEVTSKLVSVPSYPSGGVSAGNVTVDGTQYPAVWLTSLASFTMPGGGGSGGSADLSGYSTTAQMNSAIASAVTALKAEADPFLQYASNAELDTEITQRGQAVATRQPLLTPTSSKTGAYTAAASDLVMADATTASFTVTLPTLAAGGMVAVKKTDASTNTVTVTLPDASTVVLRLQGETRTFLSTGSTYTVVSGLNTLSSLDARFFAKPDETGAAVGKVVAVTGTSPTTYGLVTPAAGGGLNPIAAAIVFGG